MVPSYDFDIQWLIPREVDADPAISKLLSDIGINGNSRGNYIAALPRSARHRDDRAADPDLREYLKASGFGFIAYQSGAPAGHYPAVDESARADVVARLNENLKRFDLTGADLGGFDFGQFLKAIAEGRPLPSGEAAPEPRAPEPTKAEHEIFAMPTGFAKFSGRNRVMPFMVLSLAVTFGVYWLIHHVETVPAAF